MIQGINNIFSKEQIAEAQSLFATLSTEQRFWLSGYLSGLNQSGSFLEEACSQVVNGGSEPQALKENGKLTILYGTHTGNSRLLAEQALQVAQSQGLEAVTVGLQDYKLRKLKEEQNLLVIVSTHGEGEPPTSAEDFYDYIFGKKAPNSENINFAVIGLGDSSYLKFCQTGKDIYQQLSALGANAVHDFIGLDVDYKDNIAEILPVVLSKFTGVNGSSPAFSQKTANVSFVQDKWVEAEVLNKVLLNGRGSDKETYHIEFDIEETGLVYQPGDALEVVTQNKKPFVSEILAFLNIEEKAVVQVENEELSIKEALISKFELTVITVPVLKKYAELANSSKLNQLMSNDDALNAYLFGSDFLDLLKDYPVQLGANDLVSLLRKLTPRLYSISSSYELNPDEVHITVGKVCYHLNDREHVGVCSGYLADSIYEGLRVKIRVKPNPGFKLPSDDKMPVIMVGPGTGIAPFRSFLQEREVKDSEGKNWLFFGDQHFETDFLYQTELLKYKKGGILTRLDVAFSRDQQQKVYVQDRMREKGIELYRWLQEGAYFYVCGDMKRMAKDVKQTLVEIIKTHGKLSDEEAFAYVKALRSSGRLQEDVY